MSGNCFPFLVIIFFGAVNLLAVDNKESDYLDFLTDLRDNKIDIDDFDTRYPTPPSYNAQFLQCLEKAVQSNFPKTAPRDYFKDVNNPLKNLCELVEEEGTNLLTLYVWALGHLHEGELSLPDFLKLFPYGPLDNLAQRLSAQGNLDGSLRVISPAILTLFAQSLKDDDKISHEVFSRHFGEESDTQAPRSRNQKRTHDEMSNEEEPKANEGYYLNANMPRLQEVANLYLTQVSSYDELEQVTGLERDLLRHYLYRARKAGLIPDNGTVEFFPEESKLAQVLRLIKAKTPKAEILVQVNINSKLLFCYVDIGYREGELEGKDTFYLKHHTACKDRIGVTQEKIRQFMEWQVAAGARKMSSKKELLKVFNESPFKSHEPITTATFNEHVEKLYCSGQLSSTAWFLFENSAARKRRR